MPGRGPRTVRYPVGSSSAGSIMAAMDSPLGQAGDKESSGGGITSCVNLIKIYHT